MSSIVTGEAVALDLRVARIGSRSIALAIDVFLEIVALILLALLFGRIGVLDSAAGEAITLLLYVAVFVGYPTGFETLWRGRSPGKASMGLRVVRDDGGPVRFRHALIRGLVGALVELPGITGFVGSILSSLASERGKRLGDRAAGTVVIQERVPSRGVTFVPMPAPLAPWAAGADLSRVSNDLALGIRSFFERANELDPQARDQLGQSLLGAVLAVIAPAPPRDAPPWAILAAVLAERRRRDELRMQQQRPSSPSWQGSPPVPPWGAGTPGWGAPPDGPPWNASRPPTGVPTAVGPPPPVSAPPYYGPPPPVPPAPAPVPAPEPVPSPEPPPGFHPPS